MLKEKYNTKSLACRFHYAGLITSRDLCVQRNMVCKMHWNFLFTNYNEQVNTIWHVEISVLSVASDTALCRHVLIVTRSLSVLSCQLNTGVKVCVKSEIYQGDETDIDRVPRCANQYSSVDTFDPNVSVCQPPTSIRVLCEHLVRLNAHLVQQTQCKRMTCFALLLKEEKPLSLCFQHSLYTVRDYTKRKKKTSLFFLSTWGYFKTSCYQAGVKILLRKLLCIDAEKN